MLCGSSTFSLEITEISIHIITNRNHFTNEVKTCTLSFSFFVDLLGAILQMGLKSCRINVKNQVTDAKSLKLLTKSLNQPNKTSKINKNTKCSVINVVVCVNF